MFLTFSADSFHQDEGGKKVHRAPAADRLSQFANKSTLYNTANISTLAKGTIESWTARPVQTQAADMATQHRS